ncbi:MAG: DUF881 domain-containing protein, partial [Nocardioidaceae bacterium]
AGAAGLLMVTSALSANGTDLRSDTTDLSTLVHERTDRVADMRGRVQTMQGKIDAMSAAVDTKALAEQRKQIDELKQPAGLTEVTGPGVRVTLTDAPRDVHVEGLDPNLLVVHQQDIQAFVNALWAGGAKAITLQGQRLVSTTGIKCVGNTVVLDGVPYSPPYVIEAVGDTSALYTALDASGAVQTYGEYAERYQLGLEVESRDALVAPAYDNAVNLEYARPAS